MTAGTPAIGLPAIGLPILHLRPPAVNLAWVVAAADDCTKCFASRLTLKAATDIPRLKVVQQGKRRGDMRAKRQK